MLMAYVIGVLFASAVYMIMRRSIVKLVIGLMILSNAANLLIFTVAGLTRGAPPLIPAGVSVPAGAIADPLPQALVLTAIVISFATTALFLVVIIASRGFTGTDHVDGKESDS